MKDYNLSENAKVIMKRLQELDGADITVHDLSNDIGLTVPQITGTFNSFLKKGLGKRVVAEVETEEGKVEEVKFLKLTDVGQELNLNE